MAKEKTQLPETAEEYEAQLREKVLAKIEKKQELTGADNLILAGFVQMYDPALGAYKQVTIKDYYEFKKSLEANP